jgi:DNA polymerase-4
LYDNFSGDHLQRMDRIILHVNVVNFFVSVARVLEPRLSGYPLGVRVAGSRRVLLDVSSEAFAAGVCKGMMVEKAKRLCPELIVVDPVPAEYDKAEKSLIQIASQRSPKTETAGPGHLFIDLTGTRRLLGPSVDVADALKKRIKDQCRFDCTIGLASNRLVSKIATRVIKPNGLCTVIHGCEEEFMAPLPVNLLPGIEQRLLEQLLQFNLRLIQDLIRIPVDSLQRVLGPSAIEISRTAHGIDDTPVRMTEQQAPSVVESITLSDQTNNEHELLCVLFGLTSRAGAKIRTMGLATGKIRLRITHADGAQESRSVRLRVPIRGDLTMFDQTSALLRSVYTRRVRLTDLTLECTDLTFPYGQVDLFIDSEREENLMSAIDTIRDSFGANAIQFWGRQQMG